MDKGSPSTIRRVYFVLWWFAEFGGMEQHVANLASGLSLAGIDVVVFTQMPIRRDCYYVGQLREAGVRVVGLPGWTHGIAHNKVLRKRFQRFLRKLLSPIERLERIRGKVFGRPGNERAVAKAVKEFAYANYFRWLLGMIIDLYCRARSPDLFHVHGFRLDQVWTLAWAAKRGIPAMYTEHGTVSDWGELYEEEASLWLKEAGVIACVSDRSRESLYEYLDRSTPVTIVHHIVEPPSTLRAAPVAKTSAETGPAAAGLRVTCLGRLDEQKGVSDLIVAMRIVADQYPDVRLTLAGDGPERDVLIEEVRRLALQDHVQFRGRFAPRDLAEVMSETDLIVIPSRTEGLPLTLIEAMAYGKPIVATRVGGIPEWIRHGENGILVDSNSPGALAAGIADMLGDAEARDRLGAAARASYTAGAFSRESVVAATLECYRRALNTMGPVMKDRPACAS